MKKIVSILLCVAMLLTLTAFVSADEATATISFTDASTRTSITAHTENGIQVWEENGIKVTNDGGRVADYVNPVRFYAGTDVTIEYPAMTKLVIDCKTNNYAKALVDTIAAASDANVSASIADTIATIEFATPVDSLKVNNLTAQTRFVSMSVYAAPAITTLNYVMADYKTDELGGSACFRDLDENIRMDISSGWFNTQARIYKNAYAVLTAKTPISSITLNVGGKNSTFAVLISEDGETWTEYKSGLAYVTSPYADVTVDFESPVKFIKLLPNDQLRIATMAVTYVGDVIAPDATEPTPTEPAPTNPPATEPAPTNPPATEPAPTNPPATEPAPTEPEAPAFYKPAHGDSVTIYYPKGGNYITGTASGAKLSAGANGVVLTVSIDENGYYTFSTADGKALTSGATGNGLSLTTASKYSLWTLEEAANGWYIKNVNAAFSGKAQYIEFYSGFTTYGLNTSNVAIYTFQFVQQSATEPDPTDPPATEPAPTDPPATEPAPTEPAPTEPATEPDTAPEYTKQDSLTAGTAYKFGMLQGNVGKVFYLKGGMNGYYMDTTEDINEAIDVFVEETEGGYYFYTMVDGAKTYINMVVSGTHVNGAYEATASTVYTFKNGTLVAIVNDAEYWFGTRNDKTYTTMGPCAVSYAGFYGEFYAASSSAPTDPPATEPAPTEPPATEPAPTEPDVAPETGDSISAFIALMAVSAIAVGVVVSKKKEN